MKLVDPALILAPRARRRPPSRGDEADRGRASARPRRWRRTAGSTSSAPSRGSLRPRRPLHDHDAQAPVRPRRQRERPQLLILNIRGDGRSDPEYLLFGDDLFGSSPQATASADRPGQARRAGAGPGPYRFDPTQIPGGLDRYGWAAITRPGGRRGRRTRATATSGRGPSRLSSGRRPHRQVRLPGLRDARGGDADEDVRARAPSASCAGASGSRAAGGCPCAGCTARRRRRCSPRPTRRRGCAGSRGRRSARVAREPQYWQVQASRASTALRVILRRWTSRGMRT